METPVHYGCDVIFKDTYTVQDVSFNYIVEKFYLWDYLYCHCVVLD